MTLSLGRTSQHDVVFYAPWIAPLLQRNENATSGGAETQILLLARELAVKGYRVGLVVRNADPSLPGEVDGIRVIPQPARHAGPQLVNFVRHAAATVRTLWKLDAAVFVQRAAGRETALVALIAKIRRRRFVYSSANVIDFAFDQLERRRRNVALFHLGVKLADQVVVQTTEQGDLCRRRFKRTPVIIRSLAEPAPPRTLVPEAFLWVGRLVEYKRPLAFIDLARTCPDARFWMVATGDDTAAKRLKRKIDEAIRGLTNFEVLPPRPRSALGPLIDRAVAIVNTSDYEGMPNVFLEGWSRGVPALALSHDPDGVISREGLGGFAEGDRERFAELARQLWDERHYQEDLAIRCCRYTTREHAPGVLAARWAAVLGLAGPATTSVRQISRRDVVV